VTWAPSGSTSVVEGVCADSRSLRPGQLFVALRGARDGHDFLAAAASAGAGGLLCERGRGSAALGLGPAVLEVEDTRQALANLGSASRSRLAGPVVGVTGSVGKTSTKDLAAAALGSCLRTCFSPLSYNNELGVPLTLANAADDAEAAVLEMGARAKGHIAALCELARPDIGVVTAVAPAHTQTFGDLLGVAEAKAELVEALGVKGHAVLNGEDPLVAAMAGRSRASVLLYQGGDPSAGAGYRRRSVPATRLDLTAHDVSVDAGLRARFVARTPWGSVPVRLEARGPHQVGNALAALAVAGLSGVDLERAANALAEAPLSPWRMEVCVATSGATVINDAYNANPASVSAALEALAALPARRRVAVLGVMAELGADNHSAHLEVAKKAQSLGLDLVAVGTDLYGVAGLTDTQGVLDRLGKLGPGDAVLVKGSRVAGLQDLATLLLEL